ncbi:DNA-processing protein DprA [Carboxylicivirga mesophila]|uniref:DNA-processing protein DprA n=1 Tax=Carboxylicivirga mesophila TaxID=1166478 RepID=A0ABS5K6B1_9BACT|nr:DNA-processing protein DprA [Carboxylicivirga mesophila]MBS2210487.1 DNA-processing protein DprA [Carboxylicivirga mesophila]
MSERLKYQLGISLIKGIGPKLARNLIAYIGDEQAVFSQSLRALTAIPGIGSGLAQAIKSADVLPRAEQELEFIHKHNIKVLYFTDDDYPARLSHCDDAPIALYSKGVTQLNQQKMIGIVGTRMASDDGRVNCERLVEELAQRHPGTVIVSGLAYGIDVCAHKAALKYGLPTYGVLAHGLDRIYPSVHRNVARQMLEEGGLITEFMSDTKPDRPNFVRRNRIVAGMVDALVMVESAIKGGAIITARIAQSYNRDVLAFPGKPGDELAKGGNYLIKKNIAALIENVEDLEYALGWEGAEGSQSVQASLFQSFNTKEEEQLYHVLLENKELTANELCVKSGLPVSKVSASMLSLEFAGLVKCLPGNAFRLFK